MSRLSEVFACDPVIPSLGSERLDREVRRYRVRSAASKPRDNTVKRYPRAVLGLESALGVVRPLTKTAIFAGYSWAWSQPGSNR